jgi:hypothetical protein
MFRKMVNELKPDLILFNFHPIIMPWLNLNLLDEFRYYRPTAFIHEYLGEPNIVMFKYCFYSDTGAVEEYKNYPNVFIPGRVLGDYKGFYPVNKVPTIGSFGFGLPIKRFNYLVERVNEEYDEAVINLHMPSAFYGDTPNGDVLKAVIDSCKKEVTKPNIQLNISIDFRNEDESLEFLAGNDINIFPYSELPHKGVASSLDMGLSVKRPIACTKTYMFNHIKDIWNKVSFEDHTIAELINNGTEPLEPYYKLWTKENYIKFFDDSFYKIFEEG